jgi:hypothetical protein
MIGLPEDMDSLDDTVPSFASPPFFVPLLNSFIAFGTHVHLKDGKIIQIRTRRAPPPEDSCRPGCASTPIYEGTLLSHIGNPPPQDNPSPLLAGKAEITLRLKSISFELSDIGELVFVLHPDRLVSEGTSAYGIDNVYICRSYVPLHRTVFSLMPMQASELQFLTDEQFLSFPSEHEGCNPFLRCYTKDIWTGLNLVQETLRMKMSSYSEKQGTFCRAMDKVVLSTDCFCYITRRLSSLIIDFSLFAGKKKLPKQVVTLGMRTTTVRVERAMQQATLYTEESLEAFSLIFGACSLYGIRHRRPRMNDSRSLSMNDIINVILPTYEDDTINDRGIRLGHDGVYLYIYFSYSSYVYQANRVGQPVDCPCLQLGKLIAFGRLRDQVSPIGVDDSDDMEEESVGADGVALIEKFIKARRLFPHDGNNVLKIQRHDLVNHQIHCVVVSRSGNLPKGSTLIISQDLVDIARQIRDYNSL